MSRAVIVLAVFASVAALAAGATAEETPPTDPLEQALANPSATGLLVTQVAPDTQAAHLGLAVGDVITTYDGHPTPDVDALRAAIEGATTKAKPSVEMVVVRLDRSEHTYTLAPGRIGVGLSPVEKGQGVVALPPATEVTFDFAPLADAPHDDWYRFSLQGIDGKRGFEHGTLRRDGATLVMRREVAFDGGEQWGLNHFDVTVIMTATTPPRIVSWTFETPLAGFVGRGSIDTNDGERLVKFSWTLPSEVATDTGHESARVPGDLPLVPSYFVESLACFMPRTEGACFHYRAVEDGSGAVGRPTALLLLGTEDVRIGDADMACYLYEARTFGAQSGTRFWVHPAEHRIVRADYGGARAERASRAEALKDLHPELKPRTAE